MQGKVDKCVWEGAGEVQRKGLIVVCGEVQGKVDKCVWEGAGEVQGERVDVGGGGILIGQVLSLFLCCSLLFTF